MLNSISWLNKNTAVMTETSGPTEGLVPPGTNSEIQVARCVLAGSARIK